jgi:hypothetical protein
MRCYSHYPVELDIDLHVDLRGGRPVPLQQRRTGDTNNTNGALVITAAGGNVLGRAGAAISAAVPDKEPTLWEMYLNANRKRPLLTKMITTGTTQEKASNPTSNASILTSSLPLHSIYVHPRELSAWHLFLCELSSPASSSRHSVIKKISI